MALISRAEASDIILANASRRQPETMLASANQAINEVYRRPRGMTPTTLSPGWKRQRTRM